LFRHLGRRDAGPGRSGKVPMAERFTLTPPEIRGVHGQGHGRNPGPVLSAPVMSKSTISACPFVVGV